MVGPPSVYIDIFVYINGYYSFFVATIVSLIREKI